MGAVAALSALRNTPSPKPTLIFHRNGGLFFVCLLGILLSFRSPHSCVSCIDVCNAHTSKRAPERLKSGRNWAIARLVIICSTPLCAEAISRAMERRKCVSGGRVKLRGENKSVSISRCKIASATTASLSARCSVQRMLTKIYAPKCVECDSRKGLLICKRWSLCSSFKVPVERSALSVDLRPCNAYSYNLPPFVLLPSSDLWIVWWNLKKENQTRHCCVVAGKKKENCAKKQLRLC